jgi:hypothetical protein
VNNKINLGSDLQYVLNSGPYGPFHCNTHLELKTGCSFKHDLYKRTLSKIPLLTNKGQQSKRGGSCVPSVMNAQIISRNTCKVASLVQVTSRKRTTLRVQF